MIGQKYIVQIPCRVFVMMGAGSGVSVARPDHLNVEVYAHSPEEAAKLAGKVIEWGVRRSFYAVPDEKCGAVALRNGPRNNEECMQLVTISEEQADLLDEHNQRGNIESAKRILEEARKR